MTSVVDRPTEKTASATDDIPNVYLFPGHIFTSAEPAVVSTILGSCVAVCLWDGEIGIGGINHFLLPSNPSRGNSDLRYGNHAMTRLLEAMLQRGASVKRIVAKIVGGASVLEAFTSTRRSIGDQNVAIARDFLKAYAIHVTGDQTGGRRGRKLLFHTGNGSAYVKEI
ncbi:MAG TPA: chemotaxis protein CheD [Thermoanaerobaculia bacterium]